MSISGIGTGMLSGMSQDMFAKMSPSGGMDQGVEDFAQSLVERRDADGDGLLSRDETGLKEDTFGGMDSDGDGLLSSDELSAHMKEQLEQMSSMMGPLNMLMQSLKEGNSSGRIATSIVQEQDADGDGLLSLDETGMDEEIFGEVDADGDGYVSAEELSAGIEQAAERIGAMDGGLGMNTQELDKTSTGDELLENAGGNSGSSGESENGEEYDAYDLNKDGTVSSEEYLQAFLNGDMSLAGMFGEGPSQGQTLTQRLAFQAYNAQASL